MNNKIVWAYLVNLNLICIAAQAPDLLLALEESRKSIQAEQAARAQASLAEQLALDIEPDEALRRAIALSSEEEKKRKATSTRTMADTAVPLIGKYGTPYIFLKIVHMDKRSPLLLLTRAPASLLKEIGPLLSQADPENSIRFYIVVWGLPIEGELPKDRTYNMIFHPVMREWFKGTAGLNLDNFAKNVPMGLYEPLGIVKSNNNSISFNALKAESVVIHPAAAGDIAFSPNNARFTIKPENTIASFWAVAFTPDKKQALVTLNLIIHDAQLEKALSKNSEIQKKPETFWPTVIDLAAKEKLKDEDKKVLEITLGRLL